MAVFAGQYVDPNGRTWQANSVARLVPGSSSIAQVARHRRIHNGTTYQAQAAARRIVAEGWNALSAEARTAWKSGASEAAFNRDNHTNGVRNGFIYFSRANFASAWYLSKADRVDNETPSWSLANLSLSGFLWNPARVTLNFRTWKSPGDPRQPRLFVYNQNPARKGPPANYRNTRLIQVYEDTFTDAGTVALPLTLNMPSLPGWPCTIILRLATDGGYSQTQWCTALAE